MAGGELLKRTGPDASSRVWKIRKKERKKGKMEGRKERKKDGRKEREEEEEEIGIERSA